MNLKMYQSPLMNQARKKKSLKKPMEKRLLQNSLKKYQKALSLLIQTQTMNKNYNKKKYQKPLSTQSMDKGQR